MKGSPLMDPTCEDWLLTHPFPVRDYGVRQCIEPCYAMIPGKLNPAEVFQRIAVQFIIPTQNRCTHAICIGDKFNNEAGCIIDRVGSCTVCEDCFRRGIGAVKNRFIWCADLPDVIRALDSKIVIRCLPARIGFKIDKTAYEWVLSCHGRQHE